MPREPKPALHRSNRAKSLPKLTDRLPLGVRKETVGVSPYCLGIVSDPKAIPAAFDAGINFFFVTADMHWPLYEGTRKGLEMLFRRKGVRDRVVVGVVSYVTQPEFCHAPFSEVIQALPGLERIDLTIMGGAYSSDFLTRLDQYRHHRASPAIPGVRATGASFHDRRAAAYAARHALLDIAFCRYNVMHRGAEHDLFPFVDPESRTLLYNFISTYGFLGPKRYEELALSRSHWRPKRTDYYRFVLARTELDGILCAPGTPREVRDLARAIESGPLTGEELEYIRDLADLHQGNASLA